MPHILHLDDNCPGKGLIRTSPDLKRALNAHAQDFMAYPHAEDGFGRSVAEMLGVSHDNVIMTGSTLQQMDEIVRFARPTHVVFAYADFRGFRLIANRNHVPSVVVHAKPGVDTDLYTKMADAVRPLGHPLVMLTIGTTNPLHTVIDAKQAVTAIHAANPLAMILIDTAYIDYCGISHADLAKFASETLGVILLNPCSKTHFVPGAAVGWMVMAQSPLMKCARAIDYPFRTSGSGARMVKRLIDKPASTEGARALVCEARDMNVETAQMMFGSENVIHGAGPFLLANAGFYAGQVVDRLKAEGVLIQRQSGQLGTLADHWIRVSATVPNEAIIFRRKLSKVMGGRLRAH